MSSVVVAQESLRGTSLHPPEVEESYRARFLREDGRQAAAIIGLASLTYFASARQDATFVAGAQMVSLLWAVRLLGVLVGVATSVVALRTTRPAVLDAAIVGWVLFSAGYSVLLQSTRPDDWLLPVERESAFFVLVWTVLPTRFRWQALSALLVAGQVIAWLVLFRRPLKPAELMVIVLALTFANAVGAFSSWRSQRLRRRLFVEHALLLASRAETKAKEDEVKRLSALLPICMYCKKIRNDEGQWEGLERYISERTASKFSHGMCDDCFSTHGHGE